MVDAADVLVLIDRCGGARRAIIDGRLVGVRLRERNAQEFRGIALNAVGRNDVPGKRLARRGIEDRNARHRRSCRSRYGRRRHEAVPPNVPEIWRPDSQLKKKNVCLALHIRHRTGRRCWLRTGCGSGAAAWLGTERLEGASAVNASLRLNSQAPSVKRVGAALGGEIDLPARRAADLRRVGAACRP